MQMANPFQTLYEHCQQNGLPNSGGERCILHWDFNVMNMQTESIPSKIGKEFALQG